MASLKRGGKSLSSGTRTTTKTSGKVDGLKGGGAAPLTKQGGTVAAAQSSPITVTEPVVATVKTVL